MRVAIATVTGLVVLTAGGVFIAHLVTTDLPLRLPVGPSCVVSGGSGASGAAPGADAMAVDSTQLANASTISATGIRRGVPQRAVLVALATALQESKLENLPDGDRDSIGLFQQRPSYGWGRPEQLNDPRYAANAFYSALLKVPHWDRMRVTDAAQAVQHSAHPQAYERWSTEAEVLANALTGVASGAVTCTVGRQPQDRGPAAAQALASNLRLDWGDVRTDEVGDAPGLAVTVRSERAGWQYAHWLVAHAEQDGIKRVRFNTSEWTAKRARWDQVSDAAPATALRVIAEVYAA